MQFSIKHILLFFLLALVQLVNAQPDDTRMYIFGHSLLDHRPPINPTPSDETTVPHWLKLLTDHESGVYEATGQYGFLPQHANLPPNAQWGYDIVDSPWDSETQSFSEADFTTILMTAGNFMQWQAPDDPYPGEGGITPVSATENIVDWLILQEDSLEIYIYENWPDMAPYINGGGFPPTETEFENYNNYTTGAFHDWWIDYQDLVLNSRPDINVRMIPAGPIMAKLFGDTILNNIPILDLYEDNAPHGRPTTYFVASLITYMAIHNQKAAIDYNVPPIVHSIVANNYEDLVNYIWNELNEFNDDNGISRVFYPEAPLPISLLGFEGTAVDNGIKISWVTAHEEFQVDYEIEHSLDGISFDHIGTSPGNGPSSESQQYSFIHEGDFSGVHFYRLKQIDPDGTIDFSPIIAVTISTNSEEIEIYPNPVQHTLNIEHDQSKSLDYEIISIVGQSIHQGKMDQESRQIDLSYLEAGVYLLKIDNQVFKILKSKTLK